MARLQQTRLIADRYRLLHPLGHGGMGRVWRARDETLQREVAVKELIAPPGVSDADRRELQGRAMREARAIARVNHPNIVRVFDVVRDGQGDPWIVMEYLAGRSLQDHIDDDGPLPPERVAGIGLLVLRALQTAHEHGVVHRDVKPSNVLLTEDRVVLTDFGIASVPDDPFATKTGLVLGSPSFLAPERARDGVTGREGDLWALGATLYAAVEGHPPFARATTVETLTALAVEPVPPPRSAGRLTPALMGLLAKDPKARLDAVRAEESLRRAIDRPRARPVAPPVQPRRTAERKPAAREPAGQGPTAREAGRRRRTPGVILGLFLVATVAYLLVNAGGPDGGTTATPTTGQSSPAPSPTAVATPSASPTAAAGFRLPAGWSMLNDGTGFRVPVPNGWRFSRDEDGRPQWQDPSGRLLLLIDQTRRPKPDPVRDWLNNEAARREDYRDYRRLRLEAVPYWDSAADWEFTYTSGSGISRRVLNRGFITAPDQAYSIYWRTPAAEWDAHSDDLRVVLDGFVPARG